MTAEYCLVAEQSAKVCVTDGLTDWRTIIFLKATYYVSCDNTDYKPWRKQCEGPSATWAPATLGNTYIHTYIHAYIQAYIHACIHTYMHAYIPVKRHTSIKEQAHQCNYTYMHIPHTCTYTSHNACRHTQEGFDVGRCHEGVGVPRIRHGHVDGDVTGVADHIPCI